jgi:WD40 repeat protein
MSTDLPRLDFFCEADRQKIGAARLFAREGGRSMRSIAVMMLAVGLGSGASSLRAEQPQAPPATLVRVVGHTDPITTLAFSPDGKTLATGSDDYTVKLWNVATGLMLRTIEGHPYHVEAVAFSGNGKDVLSVSQLNKITVNISDAVTGKLKRSLDNPEALTKSRLLDKRDSIAFSPNGSLLALAVSSSSGGRMIEIIDTNTGSVVRRIGLASDTHLVFSPDGRQLAATNDQTVTLWDPVSGKELRRLGSSWLDVFFKKQWTDKFGAVAFSPDGRKLAAAAGKTLVQFDADSGKVLSATENDERIEALAFSPDGRSLATVSGETIDIRDAATGTFLRKLDGGHPALVFSSLALAFSPDGRSLASGGSENIVKLWDAATWSLASTIEGLDYTIGAVAVSADGATVASDSYGGFTVLWDVADGRFLRALDENRKVSSGTYNYSYSIGFSPDGQLLASGSRSTTTLVWEVATGKAVVSITNAGNDGLIGRSVAFLPPANALLIGAATYSRYNAGTPPTTTELPPVIVDPSAKKILHMLDGAPHTSGTYQFVYPIAVSPDGKLVAAASRDNVVNIFEAASGRRVRSIKTSEIAAVALAISADGKILASANLGVPSSTIELWDVETGSLLRKIDTQTVAIRSLAFSSDNQIIATGGEDEIIKLWNLADGTAHGSLRGHDGWVTSLAFASTGNILVSGSRDGTLMIWRTGSFDLLATLIAEPSGEWLAITPEGFFDGAGRNSRLGIVSGLEAHTIDPIYDVLHRPDLVGEKLRGDPQGNVRAAATKLDLMKLIGQP